MTISTRILTHISVVFFLHIVQLQFKHFVSDVRFNASLSRFPSLKTKVRMEGMNQCLKTDLSYCTKTCTIHFVFKRHT